MPKTTNGDGAVNEVLISSDSHVMEAPDLLVERVPQTFRDRTPRFPKLKVGEGFQSHPGGQDPNGRIQEMETDGVSAEVLYPTHLLGLFGLDDAKLQEACFRAYNDWLIEYCQVAPKRLVGIGAISVYDIDQAVKELERCKKAELRGAIIWQAAHPDLPFYSSHYDKFWTAAQEMDMPVNLHILTRHSYHKNRPDGVERYRGSVNLKLADVADALFELIYYGVLERYPGLKIVTVENEVGWLPFMLQQWDYYYRRFRRVNPPPIDKDPSEYFYRQIYATFFRDTVGGHNFDWWGVDNCMWSNDFPHENSTWPDSHKYIERDLGHLPPDKRFKLLCGNVAKLYGLEIPKPLERRQESAAT